MSDDWGECAWTACDLLDPSTALDARTIGYLFELDERSIRALEGPRGPSYGDWEEAARADLQELADAAIRKIEETLLRTIPPLWGDHRIVWGS